MPTAEQQEMGEFQDVVTVFLTHRSKILVLKRSREVGTYKGHWAGVSGYLESEDPLKQAYSEMAEEVGLSEQDVTLVKAGKPLEIVDDAQDRAWRVHPFLFSVHEPDKIRLDWENIEMRWILPEEIDQLKTVPALKETLERVIGDG
ncbi:MAG: NUDIX pyrophosphatase [Deltaproteobacteria bacterium]|nr:NUDIX pyrophosphatase [Deltaproteobacteria bacterium]MDH3926694.1 NUDIX pyrophosphatase [Deltaproteobacteria bacterium]MDH3949717.1 NUDIX pyrophosphatase [Deltaproteobacteria bacterium]